MNNSLKVAVSAGLLAMLVVGCGSSGDGKNVSSSDMKGDWVGLCRVDGASSSQNSFNITNDKINRRDVEYSNATCNNIDSEILFDTTYIYGYVLGDNFKTSNGKETTKLDLTLKGFIEDKGNLAIKPTTGTKSYSIVYIENKKLFTGEVNATYDGKSEAARPIVIDFTEALEKK